MSQPNNKQRDSVLAAFLLSNRDAKDFSSAIYAAQLASLLAAYADAADSLGIDAGDIEPPDSILATLARNSKSSGESIVDTYNTSVTSEAERFASGYSGDDLASALKSDLVEWAKARDAWKSEQIAQAESSRGYSAGVDWLTSDILSGDVDLPDGVQQSDLVVVVYPPDAEEPECQALCDDSPYPLDEADAVLGIFPLHPNCDHWTEISFAS